MTNFVERAAEVIARVDSAERGYDTDISDIIIFRNAAQALADAGLLATDEHDAKVRSGVLAGLIRERRSIDLPSERGVLRQMQQVRGCTPWEPDATNSYERERDDDADT